MGASIWICTTLQSRTTPTGHHNVASSTFSYDRSEDEALAFAYKSKREANPAKDGWSAPDVVAADISECAPNLLRYLLTDYGLTLNDDGAIVRESGEVVAELKAAGGAR